VPLFNFVCLFCYLRRGVFDGSVFGLADRAIDFGIAQLLRNVLGVGAVEELRASSLASLALRPLPRRVGVMSGTTLASSLTSGRWILRISPSSVSL
jgi:hypothetical protein